MSAGVEVDGLNKLVRTLKQAGVDLAALKEANIYAARVAADRIQSFTPRDTGKLASSVRGNATPRGGRVMAGRARIPYAAPINYGWPRRGIRAADFMARGARAAEPLFLKEYEQAIQDVCDSVEGAT